MSRENYTTINTNLFVMHKNAELKNINISNRNFKIPKWMEESVCVLRVNTIKLSNFHKLINRFIEIQSKSKSTGSLSYSHGIKKEFYISLLKISIFHHIYKHSPNLLGLNIRCITIKTLEKITGKHFCDLSK